MSSHQEQLNFLLIPLMAPGHSLPMMDMARLLAQRGVTVTVITTTLNAIRFSSVIERATASGLPIRLLQVRFPSEEAGLPEGCESADTLPSYDLIRYFFEAIDMLQQPIEKLIEDMKPAPSCIVCDKHIAWTAETTRKFQIPRIIFDGMSCFAQLCIHNLYVSEVHKSVSNGNQPFIVPNLPDTVEFTKSQLPGMFNPGSTVNMDDFRERIRVTETEAYGVVINSFEELEKNYVDGFRAVKGGKVWCIGPLSLCNKNDLDKAQRGSGASRDTDKYLKWLDSWQPGTVIYACLGSLSRLSPPQFIELALGLEASNRPFVLVVKAKEKVEEIERWISENGFEERTKGRSLLIRGWAPQVLILSHRAIGGFLTHCGWNSTLEGVSAGVPMVTWPLFGEQFFNEKLVVQVLGTGVGVGAKAVRHLGEEEKSGITVRRHEIEKAILRVMNEEQEANERRKRAKALGEMAERSMEKGGSSDLNMALLIQDIILVNNAQSTKGTNMAMLDQ